MRQLSVAICSYQRRDLLLFQLAAIDKLARLDPDGWDGVEVVVVLDGSSDGSREALERLSLGVPLRFHWQPNAGRSAARNVLLRLVEGELIWLLDDDLVPDPGCLARHRLSHESGDGHLLLGPCMLPSEGPSSAGVRSWWEARNSRMAQLRVIDSFTDFSVANLSGPVDLLRQVGGFNEEFVLYGLEDNELGARVLATGYRIDFDPDAIVWHHSPVSERETFLRQRSLGMNAGLFVRIHPEHASSRFPEQPTSPLLHRIAGLPVGRAAVTWMVARFAYRLLNTAERFFGRRAWRLRRLAWEGAYASGVCQAAKSFTDEARRV